ncbi:MAG: VWA domain-containing protein, partial [Chromatiales bacterium]|nr:VWA domain-containing protein [Chromatiales bacterium]
MGQNSIGADSKALREAYSIVGEAESADIFLVTDGEVSEWVSVVDEAKESRNRIFTVGVGSAVLEAFVRQLAADTGGECEL